VADGRTDEDLVRIVNNNFNFRPGNIIKELDLRRPIYQKKLPNMVTLEELTLTSLGKPQRRTSS